MAWDIETCPDPWGTDVKQLYVMDTITGKCHLVTNSPLKAEACVEENPRSMIINAWSKINTEILHGDSTT